MSLMIRSVKAFLNIKHLNPLHLKTIGRPTLCQTSFLYSTDSSDVKTPNEGEQKLTDLLRQRFPKSKHIEVSDISGGCGSMYAIYVETNEFKNLRTVKQHQLVNEVLRKEIKNMHGLRIQTAIADD